MDTLEALKAAGQEIQAAKAKTASAGLAHESAISLPVNPVNCGGVNSARSAQAS